MVFFDILPANKSRWLLKMANFSIKQPGQPVFNGTSVGDTKAILKLFRTMIINTEKGIDDSFIFSQQPYLSTTQNLNYIKSLSQETDLDQCMTILGSGDPSLSLLACGANYVTAVDLNSAQTVTYQLKKAAIRALSKKDFKRFLLSPSGKYQFDPSVYITVRNAIADWGVRELWDQIFWEFKPRQIENIFKGGIDSIGKDPELFLPYLDDTAYEVLKKALDQDKTMEINDNIFEVLLSSNPKDYNWIDITNALLFTTYLSILTPRELDKVFGVIRGFFEQMDEGVFVLDYMFGITFEKIKAFALKNPQALVRFFENPNAILKVSPETKLNEIYAYWYLKFQEQMDIEHKILPAGRSATKTATVNQGYHDTLIYALKRR